MTSPVTGAGNPTGKAFVVVVDDDPANRRLMRGILELEGYRVLAKASGEECWDWMQSYSGTIDALVTDVRMPGMSGKELADLVMKGRPEIKILFVTGFSDFSAWELVGNGDPQEHILQKPFDNDALLRKVAALLAVRHP